MHQVAKGKNWFFGVKLHIGVDSRTGLAHSAVVTAANVHDKHPLPELLHGEELKVYGDCAYAGQQELIASKAPAALDCTNGRVRKVDGEPDESQRLSNRKKSKVRAQVEHVFAVVNRLWGFSKGRYCGLHKNATRPFTALALANIYMIPRAAAGGRAHVKRPRARQCSSRAEPPHPEYRSAQYKACSTLDAEKGWYFSVALDISWLSQPY